MPINQANRMNDKQCRLTVSLSKCNFLQNEKSSTLLKQLQKAIQQKNQDSEQSLTIVTEGRDNNIHTCPPDELSCNFGDLGRIVDLITNNPMKNSF